MRRQVLQWYTVVCLLQQLAPRSRGYHGTTPRAPLECVWRRPPANPSQEPVPARLAVRVATPRNRCRSRCPPTSGAVQNRTDWYRPADVRNGGRLSCTTMLAGINNSELADGLWYDSCVVAVQQMCGTRRPRLKQLPTDWSVRSRLVGMQWSESNKSLMNKYWQHCPRSLRVRSTRHPADTLLWD